jgi:hypothetical protein
MEGTVMQNARELLATRIAPLALLATLTAGCSFTLPYAGSVSTNGNAFSVTNTSTNNTLGVPNGVVGVSSGAGYGVMGTSKTGLGVYGLGGDTGVFGTSTTSGAGVHGNVDSGGIGVIGGTNTGTGVLGESSTGTGVTGAIILNGSGNLFTGCVGNLAACTGNMFRVDNTGKVFADGGYVTGGADVAEAIEGTGKLGPGDVVEVDPNDNSRFRLAATPNSTAVAGVISTAPGVTLNTKNAADAPTHKQPQLALVGRVPVKVTAEHGFIRPGDLLVTSSTLGHAMRAPSDPKPGTVVGKALGRLDKDTGVIEMLVMLR